MARARLRQFASRYISTSDEMIIGFYEHLDAPIELRTLNMSLKVIGCGERLTLPKDSINIIELFLNRSMTCTNAIKYPRFLVNGILFCTADYAEPFQRDNSCIITDQFYARIIMILRISSVCTCTFPSNENNCFLTCEPSDDSRTIILGYKYRRSKLPTVHDSFTDTDLTSFISKIDDAETEFVVLDPMEIKCKFLTISCSNVSLAIPITCRFEFD
jgi:hypothetical protein